MIERDEKYPFLDMISASEAANRGVDLVDRDVHQVYKEIQDRSSFQSARKKELFTFDAGMDGSPTMTREELKRVLQRLIEDQVVVQLVRIENEPGDLNLRLVPCFLARQSDSVDVAGGIFHELISQSLLAMEARLENLPERTVDQIYEDLLFDFKSETRPLTGDLRYTVEDLFAVLDLNLFDILPPIELITATTLLLKAALKKEKVALELPHGGFLPIRKEEMLNRFQSAARFLVEKVIPFYRDKSELGRDLQEIGLEEARAVAKGEPGLTGRFFARRAAAVRRAMMVKNEKRFFWFAGSLCVETILQLEDFVEEFYRELYQKYLEVRLVEFRLKIIDGVRKGYPILELPESGYLELEKDLRKKIEEEKTFFMEKRELSDGVHYLFFPLEPTTFAALVFQVLRHPDSPWKMQALVQVHRRRKKEAFGILLDNPDFQSAMERLQVLAHRDSFPLWIRLFLSILPVSLFRSSLEERIYRCEIEQKKLRELREKNSEKRNLTQLKNESIQDNLRFQILGDYVEGILDQFYYEKKKIPTVEEVFQSSGGMGEFEFLSVLKAGKFQKIPVDRDSGSSTMILLYPLNHGWRGRSIRLFSLLEKIFLDQEFFALNPIGQVLLSRARVLEKYLHRLESSGAVGSGDGNDPYDRFRKALEKYSQAG